MAAERAAFVTTWFDEIDGDLIAARWVATMTHQVDAIQPAAQLLP